jgi:hypothetical protein
VGSLAMEDKSSSRIPGLWAGYWAKIAVVNFKAFNWTSLELEELLKDATEELLLRFSRKKAAKASLVVERTKTSVKDPDLKDSNSTKRPMSSLHFVYIFDRTFLFAVVVGAT